MRRFRLCLATGLAGLLIAPAALATQPRLAVTDASPFTVRGAHFKPSEHVRVVVSMVQGASPRTVVASTTGVFVVRYSSVTLGSCPSYIVRATGNLGSRATLKVMPPECANGPAP